MIITSRVDEWVSQLLHVHPFSIISLCLSTLRGLFLRQQICTVVQMYRLQAKKAVTNEMTVHSNLYCFLSMNRGSKRERERAMRKKLLSFVTHAGNNAIISAWVCATRVYLCENSSTATGHANLLVPPENREACFLHGLCVIWDVRGQLHLPQ